VSADPAGVCQTCGGRGPGQPGIWCGECGARFDALPWANAALGSDDATIDVSALAPLGPIGSTGPFVVAGATDRGRRHRRNEDSFDLVLADSFCGAALADGVSSTANPHLASRAATRGAQIVLAQGLQDLAERRSTGADAGTEGAEGADTDAAVEQAIATALAGAWRGVAEVEPVEPHGYPDPPSTTLVLGVVAPGRRISIASVGDSRAYWIAEHEAIVLSTDDSWAEQAIMTGVEPAAAYRSPMAHVITRWLDGAGANREQEMEIVHHQPDVPGFLLLCTDGLWNYWERLDELHTLALGTGLDEDPLSRARRLVQAAVDAGGADNVTVVVIPVP
jgi:serine/threonine protein phosphatase PrpC